MKKALARILLVLLVCGIVYMTWHVILIAFFIFSMIFLANCTLDEPMEHAANYMGKKRSEIIELFLATFVAVKLPDGQELKLEMTESLLDNFNLQIRQKWEGTTVVETYSLVSKYNNPAPSAEKEGV